MKWALGPFLFSGSGTVQRAPVRVRWQAQVVVVMASKQERLTDLIVPVVESLGCELWGLEYLTQGRYTTLRIFIDGPQGVSLDDCERVSRQISAVLDVEDPIDGEYTLEVSSPGLDRPLYTEAQYARYVGETVNLRLRIAVEGRRRFKGVISAIEEGALLLQFDNQTVRLPIETIDKGNLVPRYDDILREHAAGLDE
ncbi:Uncharacterized BCR, YhbC family [Cellvibrio japonicus Ueda107]|nr:Uncharacterized BCR, YhbC family [Cellvibrio japonicus Ueda107]